MQFECKNNAIFDEFSLITFVVTFSEYASGFYFGRLLLCLLALLHHHKSAPSFWSNNSGRWKDFSFDEPFRRSLTWKHKNIGSVFRWLLLPAILFWEFTGADSNKNQEVVSCFSCFFCSTCQVYNLMKRYLWKVDTRNGEKKKTV